jgi:3-phenylpropionate/trans-cinnamate dioxygenase ferredoxin reductase subunit
MMDDARHSPFVIVGASLAGATAAAALREEGFSGRIVLVGEELERPYERPPLSKDYLQGRSEREKIFVHPSGWYAEHDVELQLGTRVVRVDAGEHELTVADGRPMRYDKLLLCTGSSPRQLPVPGADLDGVLYLRTVGDSERIMETLASVSRLAVIGAGWIGLEVTAAARNAGVDVTLLEMMELPLLRVLGSEVAQLFAGLHRSHGVDLRFGVRVEEITGRDGQVTGVRLAGGRQVEVEAVVVGVGITPNTELAVGAGLLVDNGVVVDEHLRSSDPDVCAAGDVANALHPLLGRHIRVEHWANALNQPRTAAKTMLGGDAIYDRVPYFFTDQYELGMEYSGYVEPDGYDEVVFRGDPNDGEYIAFWLQDGRVLAGMNVNVWDVTDAIQALVRSRRPVDVLRLSDPDVPLTDVAESS